MPEQKLETKIDTFVDEITKRGKMTFPEAAKLLGITEEQVEEWANLLSSHKEETHIDIEYPTVGDPVIVTTIEKKKVEIKAKVETLRKEKKEVVEKVEVAEKVAKKVATEPIPKTDDISSLIKDLDEKTKGLSGLERDFTEIENECEDVEDALKKTEQEEKELIDKTDKAKEKLKGTKNHLDSLVTSLTKKMSQAESVKSHLDELNKLKSDTPRSIETIKTELKDLEKELRAVEEEARTLIKPKIKSKVRRLLGG